GRQRAGVPLGRRDPGCDLCRLHAHLERLAADPGSAPKISQQRANPSECSVQWRRRAAFLAHASAREGGLMRPLGLRITYELVLGAVLAASLVIILRQAARIAEFQRHVESD